VKTRPPQALDKRQQRKVLKSKSASQRTCSTSPSVLVIERYRVVILARGRQDETSEKIEKPEKPEPFGGHHFRAPVTPRALPGSCLLARDTSHPSSLSVFFWSRGKRVGSRVQWPRIARWHVLEQGQTYHYQPRRLVRALGGTRSFRAHPESCRLTVTGLMAPKKSIDSDSILAKTHCIWPRSHAPTFGSPQSTI
jgi:hypothetical protein